MLYMVRHIADRLAYYAWIALLTAAGLALVAKTISDFAHMLKP